MTKLKEHYARCMLTRAFLAHVERFRRGPVGEEAPVTTCAEKNDAVETCMHAALIRTGRRVWVLWWPLTEHRVV